MLLAVKDNYNGPNGPRIGTHEPCKALLIKGFAGKRCSGARVDGPNEIATVIRQVNPDQVLDRVSFQQGQASTEIFDLYGNVAEWVCATGDVEYYFKPKTRKDPTGPAAMKS